LQDVFRELSEEIEEANIPVDLGGPSEKNFYDSPQEIALKQFVEKLNSQAGSKK
jgi:hypothetical protein